MRKRSLVREVGVDCGILLAVVTVRAQRRVEVDVLRLVQRGDPLERRRVERHVLVRRVRRTVRRERVAAHEVLDAIDAHKDRVARIHADSPIAGIEMAGHRESVQSARARSARVAASGVMPFALNPLHAVLRPVIDFGVDLCRPMMLRSHSGRAVPKYGPEFSSRGPGLQSIIDPDAQRRASTSGFISPAGNVDVTPFARKSDGYAVVSSLRPALNRSIA